METSVATVTIQTDSPIVNKPVDVDPVAHLPNGPGLRAIKFYRSGIKLIFWNDTEKKYKFARFQNVELFDDRIEIVHRGRSDDGKSVLKRLTVYDDFEGMNCPQKIVDYWQKWQNDK